MSTRIGSLTRAIAIDALTHVLTRRIHADVALDKLFAHHKDLRPLDRAFIFEMVYGTLRWLSKMDWIMGHMMDRPFSSLDPRVANGLRIGTYQIYYMTRVPDRAAVAETVEAMKMVGMGKASSFVNAVLRRVARKAEYFPKPDKEKHLADYYAMHYSHPKWMVQRWMQHIQAERLEHIFNGNNESPSHNLRIIQRNPLPSEEDLATWLLRNFSISSHWRPLKNSLRIEKLPPFERCEAFAQGCYVVQDEAAQLAVSLVQPKESDTVLDACAAPGTKSIVLWDNGLPPENLTVVDSSQKRMDILEKNFERVGLKGCTFLKGDAAEVTEGMLFDKVLLDAPCSGLGIIRRHPESKWLRSLGDIERNIAEQEKLLNNLCEKVRPGGELVYMVCSFERDESIQQISKFLETHKNFECVNLFDRVHEYYRRYVSHRGDMLIYSGNHDSMDGFYAAVLRRKTSTQGVLE